MKRHRLTTTLLLALAMQACRTTEEAHPLEAEPRTSDVDAHLDRVFTAATSDAAHAAAAEIERHRESAEAEGALLARLRARRDAAAPAALHAGVELYLLLHGAQAPRVFEVLAVAKRPIVRRIAWQVAARHPSSAMASLVSAEIGRRAAKSASTGFSPEAAAAAKANDLKDAYPLIRAALMEEHHPEYARALIKLNPVAAADDLLSYLSALPGLTAERRVVCLTALSHFETTAPSLLHPGYKDLFAFATVADAMVANRALAFLSQQIQMRPKHFAFLLAQVPEGTQAAFLGKLRPSDGALHAMLADAVRALSIHH